MQCRKFALNELGVDADVLSTATGWKWYGESHKGLQWFYYVLLGSVKDAVAYHTQFWSILHSAQYTSKPWRLGEIYTGNTLIHYLFSWVNSADPVIQHARFPRPKITNKERMYSRKAIRNCNHSHNRYNMADQVRNHISPFVKDHQSGPLPNGRN